MKNRFVDGGVIISQDSAADEDQDSGETAPPAGFFYRLVFVFFLHYVDNIRFSKIQKSKSAHGDRSGQEHSGRDEQKTEVKDKYHFCTVCQKGTEKFPEKYDGGNACQDSQQRGGAA